MSILNNARFLQETFAERNANPLGVQDQYGILIPLINRDGQWHVLFEERAHSLRAQPGEICFPGGRCELDETTQECAIRETCEELGLRADQIHVLGPSDYVVSPFRALLLPYVGIVNISSLNELVPNSEEVASVFTIPLDYLFQIQPEIHELETQVLIQNDFPYHKINKGKDYPWKMAKHKVIFYEYEDRIVWGLTASLLKGFLDIVKKIN